MIPYDDELSDDRQRHETARRVRRVFEVVVASALLVTTFLVATWSTGRIFAAYTYLILVYVWAEGVRRGLRQFGQAQHMGEAAEWAKGAPFCAVAAYILGWLGASELLLGTGALTAPFGRPVTMFVTLLLLSAALLVTWRGPGDQAARRIDVMTASVWLVLALPADVGSPRTAPVWTSVVRVACMLLLHFTLGVREEGRLSPARWTALTREAGVHVTSVAANMSAFRLVQTAWTLHCTPIVLPIAGLTLAVLNEIRGRMRPRPTTTTPPPIVYANGPAQAYLRRTSPEPDVERGRLLEHHADVPEPDDVPHQQRDGTSVGPTETSGLRDRLVSLVRTPQARRPAASGTLTSADVRLMIDQKASGKKLAEEPLENVSF